MTRLKKKMVLAIGACVVVVLVFLVGKRRHLGERVSTLGDSKTSSVDSNTNTNGALVNVIEEHHEALLYWFTAAKTGTLPKKGNILFHIDGHPDADDPDDWRKVPLYRMPRNEHELNLMMQQNDIFIQIAAGTGLINRFIWVWPKFDVGGWLHWNNEAYVSMKLEVGIMYQDKGAHPKFELCYCLQSDYFQVNHPCNIATVNRHMPEGIESFPIKRERCLDMTLGGIVEIVSTDKAIELAKSGTWIKESDSVILDIDEDFYACEAVSAPLYDAGMNEDDIDSLSLYIGKILCTDNAKDEMEADRYFQKLLKAVQETLKHCRSGRLGVETCESNHAFTEAVLALMPDMTITRDIMCLPKASTQFMLVNLVERLKRCSDTQLQHIARIGVCMYASPRSTNFNRNKGMVLCKGYNGPMSEKVLYHSTNEQEIAASSRNLQKMLTQAFIPKVVTVCRSVRDGYTPRKEFPLIEEGVLSVLKAVYPDHVTDDTIHYDSELLGGREGWYTRYTR
ncbi:uncharacterized protein [Haliotis asinina]|uniref:uncharacterized protein n=1 Tax=Haliotis asinina TaxID=109174 RepID=UPI0035319682